MQGSFAPFWMFPCMAMLLKACMLYFRCTWNLKPISTLVKCFTDKRNIFCIITFIVWCLVFLTLVILAAFAFVRFRGLLRTVKIDKTHTNN